MPKETNKPRKERTGVFVKLPEETKKKLEHITFVARKSEYKNKDLSSYSRIIDAALQEYLKSDECRKLLKVEIKAA